MIQNLIFGVYLLILDFLKDSLKANKNIKKVHAFYNTVALKKPHSFYELQLTQHYKKHALAIQPKTLLFLQIFQQTCFWLVSKRTALHHF